MDEAKMAAGLNRVLNMSEEERDTEIKLTLL